MAPDAFPATVSSGMLDIVIALIRSLASAFGSRKDLALENLALRQQLAVAKRHMKRSNLTDSDRIFWIVLARCWDRWRDVVLVVKPDTVVRWHRLGFRYYWRKKSKPGPGRPRIAREVRDLIREMRLATSGICGTPSSMLESVSVSLSTTIRRRSSSSSTEGCDAVVIACSLFGYVA